MLFITALLIWSAQSIQFGLTIKSKELKCFGENIPANYLFVGSVLGNSSEYSFKIHIPSKKADSILLYTHSSELHKFSYTSNHTKYNYQFCIHNLAQTPSSFNFSLKLGNEAQDFSLLAQKEDLKPLEIHLKKLNGLVNAIELDQKDIESRQSEKSQNIQKMSYKIIILSGITLILMMLTNFVQAKKLKNFFKQKKLI